MKMYKIGEFRKNIKEALDYVDKNEEGIGIYRYGKVYMVKVPHVLNNYPIPKTTPSISKEHIEVR